MKIATAGFTCVDNYANLNNRHYPAGNGFDALVNLAKMGAECAVVSAVGPDKYGEEMFDVLKKYGVDSSHLHVLPGETSFMIMEMTENNDRVHVKNIPGVMDDFELTRDDIEFLKGYDYVHTEFSKVLYPYLAELQEAGCKIIFDLSTSYERHAETETLLKNIDYAFMSYPQRDEHVKELMKKYQSLGPTLVVATFGEDGSLVWDGKEFYSAGITPAEKVVNTVGAGDSFLAGFMHGIMSGKSIPECQKEGADLSAKIVAMFDPY